MRTLGVDLASDPERTGLCTLEWDSGRARVAGLRVGVGTDDDALVEEHGHAAATGIDCPFAWPAGFLAFLCGTTRLAAAPSPKWSKAYRDSLRFRTTDVKVHELTKHWPLSVSSDLIAVAAMRCQGLLVRMGVRDRSGDGRVFEVYPAAALKRWGLPCRKYKGQNGQAVREDLVTQMVARAPWLGLDAEQLDLLKASDDALDALVASLNDRAAWLGLTLRPGDDERREAAREGWIAIPLEKDSLDRLAAV
jgi:predicted nuclease with RNAse H fold